MMSAAYSLLELIFSMAILFILISAATISLYQQHRIRIYRLDAQQSLLALMQQQQNYYSQHQRYQVDIEIEQDLNNSDESESDKKTVVSQHGYYLITVAACEDDESNQCVILKATPREMGAALLHYSLDSKNRKSPESKW
jgi:type IV pilus assembly protein PilE